MHQENAPGILLIVFKGLRGGLCGVQYRQMIKVKPRTISRTFPIITCTILCTTSPGPTTRISPQDKAPGNQPGEAIPGPGGRDNAPGIATPGQRKAPYNGGQFLGFGGVWFTLNLPFQEIQK